MHDAVNVFVHTRGTPVETTFLKASVSLKFELLMGSACEWERLSIDKGPTDDIFTAIKAWLIDSG